MILLARPLARRPTWHSGPTAGPSGRVERSYGPTIRSGRAKRAGLARPIVEPYLSSFVSASINLVIV